MAKYQTWMDNYLCQISLILFHFCRSYRNIIVRFFETRCTIFTLSHTHLPGVRRDCGDVLLWFLLFCLCDVFCDAAADCFKLEVFFTFITGKASRIWGAENPKPIDTKFFVPGAIQDAITPANFCEDRLRGFWCGEGSNFGLFHWLASSPLKHSRTTVWVCDTMSSANRHFISVLLLFSDGFLFFGFHLCLTVDMYIQVYAQRMQTIVI